MNLEMISSIQFWICYFLISYPRK